VRVVVCCKGVPIEAPLESVHIVGGDIRFGDTDLYINELDAYALEAALALKNSHGVETVALTLGPLRASEVLYIALAKGIDRVLRVDGETSLPELVAGGLTAVLRELSPDLILVGVQSEDWMGGEVGIYLSQTLNLSLACAVVEICELNKTHVRIKKEIGGGRKAEIRMKMPAVLCVQSGIQPLHYLSIMKRQKARNTPVKLWGKLDVKATTEVMSGRMAYEIIEVSLPSREGHAQMITGDRSEKVAKLLEIITKTA